MSTPAPSKNSTGQRFRAVLMGWRGGVAVVIGLAALFLGSEAARSGNWSLISPGDFLLALIVGGAVYAAFAQAEHQVRLEQELRIRVDSNVGQLAQAHDAIARLNDRLDTAQRELVDLGRTKSEFMTRMSHELRTPLNSVVGYSELVLEGVYGELTEPQRNRLERILRNARNLLGLINDILDLSRIDAGQLELAFTPVRVAEAIRLAVASQRPQAEAKGLTIQVEIDGDPPHLRADELRLRQIVTNLLDNAIKFTETGQITVRVRCVQVEGLDDLRFPQLGHGDWLLVSVMDNGIGIDPALHDTIFEDFAQADTSASRVYEGIGLGLAITRRLVQLHGGAIWVESEPGVGSTFSFGIPYAPALETAHDWAPVETVEPKALVLAVDDEDEALDILDTSLSQAGYTVARAHGGEQALEMAGRLKPDAIMLDMFMPDLDGWTVLERLRADPSTANIPVVIVSITDLKTRTHEMGVVDHVPKPVDRSALVRVLDATVEPKPRRPILVLDNDPKDRGTFTAALRMGGYPVIPVESETAATSWLADHCPSLVLLDLEGERLEALKVLDFMRAHSPTAQTPALVIWGRAVPDTVRQTLRERQAIILEKRGLAQETLIRTVADALVEREPAQKMG